jgi:hypothetical protein
MSFKNVRTFLTNRIKEIDSDFEVVDKPFDVDDPAATNFNKRFHIFYGDITTTTANQQTTTDIVNAVVNLYFDGYRDQTEALDESVDVANRIRMRCLQPKFLLGEKFIKRVVPTSIVATPIDSNDNKIRVRLEFSIATIMAATDNLDC